jgi:hypothetical protein
MWVLLERMKEEIADLKGKLDKQAKAKPAPEPKGNGDDELEAEVRELATGGKG